MIFDEDKRVIWFWKGQKSKIRSKFIGAKKSQELRGQVGLSNKVVSIDEGDEPPEFLQTIGVPPRPGSVVAHEMKEASVAAFAPNPDQAPPSFSTSVSEPALAPAPEPEPVYAEPEPAPAPRPAPRPAPAPAPRPAPAPAARPAPAPVARSAPAAAPAPAPVAPAAALGADVSVDRVLGILSNLKVPAGFIREMVIIGSAAYSISVKEQVFLGKKKVERTLEPIGSLPEGVFFADGYSPRVLVENGVVLAIEFLKKEASEYSETQPTEEPLTLKDHIKDTKDLVGTFGMKVKKT
ncbi:MAG: hypothetical protein Q6373_005015 [Candidatus Sigynarchaeota archaeon]